MLQAAANAPTRAKFARLTGVNAETLLRIERRSEATNRILSRISGVFQHVTPDMLANDDIDMPADLSLATAAISDRRRDEETGIAPREGAQLLRYMDRIGMKQSELSALMGVSRVQVHAYTKTVQFQAEVKGAILAALGVPAGVVFSERRLLTAQSHGTQSPVTMVPLPLVRPADRGITEADLLKLRTDFVPAENPGRVYYANADFLAYSPADLLDALAIEVAERDYMAPILRTGAIVLAMNTQKENWPDVANGSVAILTKNKIIVCRVFRNELRTANFIEVGAYDRNRGGTISLRSEDIQALYTITHILISPA